MATNEATSLNQEEYRARLRSQFKDRPLDKHHEGWNELWEAKFTPWDRNTPSPALVDALNQRTKILGQSQAEEGKQRKRALVPGCGKGYEVLLFASHGYDAFGLDVSPSAVQQAKEQLADAEHKYAVPDAVEGRGDAKVLLADFFTDSFLSQTGADNFDIIYDYTFLCALLPEMRPKWSKRMSELLSPDGKLICLEFPLRKEPKTGGPPHGLTPELYEELLSRPGEEVEYDEEGYVVSHSNRASAANGLVRVDRWLAERTHEVGKDIDHVSIWRHA